MLHRNRMIGGASLRTIIKKSNLKQEFSGERHIPMWIDGRFVMAQYCGPGTHVKQRLARGDPGLDATDKVCKQHDMDYQAISESNEPREVKIKKARIADKKMINSLRGKKGWNATIARSGIKIKNKLEDTGILKKDKYLRKRN